MKVILPFGIRVRLYLIGVNISERKGRTERTKKRKKRELGCFPPPPGGATGTLVHRLDATRILPDDNLGYLDPGALRDPD